MMEFEYPPGNYFDCYPLMIMSSAALRSIQRALPDSVVDEHRNVLRHVVRELDQNVGVYATVVRGRPIAVGDSVEIV